MSKSLALLLAFVLVNSSAVAWSILTGPSQAATTPTETQESGEIAAPLATLPTEGTITPPPALQLEASADVPPVNDPRFDEFVETAKENLPELFDNLESMPYAYNLNQIDAQPEGISEQELGQSLSNDLKRFETLGNLQETIVSLLEEAQMHADQGNSKTAAFLYQQTRQLRSLAATLLQPKTES